MVLAACRDRLGDPARWVSPDDYRHSLALCIIESVQAAGTHSADADAVVDRYRAYRHARGAGPITDGTRELLHTFEEVGSSDQWAGKIGHYKRRYCANAAPLRAAEIQRTAERLHALHIDTVGDLVGATRNRATRDDLRQAWRESCGETGGTTWQHLMVLAGVPAPNTAVNAADDFVRSVLPDGRIPSAEILAAAADRLGVAPEVLGQAVRRWRYTHDEPIHTAS
ncbi:heme peroxidase [Rhodococcus sp. ABRD24]|nr:heme peroxidase [Rhodococcus sp. ABRD24]